MKICLIQTYLPSVINFRGYLLDKLIEEGDKVWVLCPTNNSFKNYEEILYSKGITFIPLNMDRLSMNIISEISLLKQILSSLNSINPNIIIAFHPKALIYTGIILSIMKIFQKNNNISYFPVITGAGTLFDDKKKNLKSFSRRILIKILYRIGLRQAKTIIFQNEDDIREFKLSRILKADYKVKRVYGSGVSLDKFPPKPIPKEPNFLMLSRLLINKGVTEYLEASAIVKEKYPNAHFKLAGFHEVNHPSAISHELLNYHINKNHIEFLGHIKNVKDQLQLCRFYVLPSYREGTPRSVLEAMATKRPIITTDVPGCRETVINGFNGFLVPPKNSRDLALAMIKLIEQSDQETIQMGSNSYELVERFYEVNKVNKSIIKIIKS